VSEHEDTVRLFVSFPEDLVDRPMIYEVIKKFDVVPNIRRANVEANSGWIIFQLTAGTTWSTQWSRISRVSVAR
jgi:hypothetical protein